MGEPGKAAGGPLATGMERGSAFASVIVEGAPSCASVGTPSLGSGMPEIEIVMGATTVRVPPGADVTALQAVLCAVKAMSSACCSDAACRLPQLCGADDYAESAAAGYCRPRLSRRSHSA
jgi:hypothetical protein